MKNHCSATILAHTQRDIYTETATHRVNINNPSSPQRSIPTRRFKQLPWWEKASMNQYLVSPPSTINNPCHRATGPKPAKDRRDNWRWRKLFNSNQLLIGAGFDYPGKVLDKSEPLLPGFLHLGHKIREWGSERGLLFSSIGEPSSWYWFNVTSRHIVGIGAWGSIRTAPCYQLIQMFSTHWMLHRSHTIAFQDLSLVRLYLENDFVQYSRLTRLLSSCHGFAPNLIH